VADSGLGGFHLGGGRLDRMDEQFFDRDRSNRCGWAQVNLKVFDLVPDR
jgi:hypothetical protein